MILKTGVLPTLLVLTSLSTSVVAAVPQLINYSGRLTNGSGAPLSGTFDVDFNIYTSALPFLPAAWSETQSVTTDAEGLFHVLLGTVNPITDVDFSGSGRWLGIKVESDPEMTPQTRLVSVPYAFRISTIDGATGGQISGNLAIGANHSTTGNSNFLAGDSNTTTGYANSVTAGINNFANGHYSIVGGGRGNESNGTDAGVFTGNDNIVDGLTSFIGGGADNQILGARSAIVGGFNNRADGDYSFAGGHHARASEDRTFVWNGNTSFSAVDSLRSDGAGSVTFRAPGGYRFFTGTGSGTTGAELPTGSGSWTSMSDRSSKENVESVDGNEILERLSLIPITKWNYLEQGANVRHIGPMAQDFYTAFGVGEADTHISNVDADGVALAAIQALHAKTSEIEQLKRQMAEMQSQIELLMKEVYTQ